MDLTAYNSIQSNLFVRIQVDEYRTSPSGGYTSQILRFSDLNATMTIGGESYTGVGKLMEITQSSSELRVSSGEVSITISGIPDTAIAEIINSKIKGSPVEIYRALINPSTGTLLSIAGNPLGRFQGIVNNYTLNEEYDNVTRTSTNTLTFSCSSKVTILENKISGRKTNPRSEKNFFPNDLSMDRVPTLKGATFNFGAPQ